MNFSELLSSDFTNTLDNIVKFSKCNLSYNIQKVFFNTPYFKKYVNLKVNDAKTNTNNGIVSTFQLVNYIKNVSDLDNIWPNIPFDYYQEYSNILENISCNIEMPVKNWLRDNLSYKSFLNMIRRHYEKTNITKTESCLQDTFSQLNTLLQSNSVVTISKRWRLVEFHDHISYLYLKKDITNVTHNNSFIPDPYIQDKWKVYQPKDSLELAVWGNKVKNCVLSYEDKILKNQSVIVLIEEESIPKYTVELEVNHELPQVKQIVGIANSSVSHEENQMCQNLIHLASKK
jgi:hypothetical protein